MSKIDFDIALVGCGVYGDPLTLTIGVDVAEQRGDSNTAISIVIILLSFTHLLKSLFGMTE